MGPAYGTVVGNQLYMGIRVNRRVLWLRVDPLERGSPPADYLRLVRICATRAAALSIRYKLACVS
jgi:hypothetical protein